MTDLFPIAEAVGLVALLSAAWRMMRMFQKGENELKEQIREENRTLRDEVAAILLHHQTDIRDVAEDLRKIEIKCSKRHGQNGVNAS